jgi:hypothetical protein
MLVSGEVCERHAPWVVWRLVRGTDMRGWGDDVMERGSQQMEHNFSRIIKRNENPKLA